MTQRLTRVARRSRWRGRQHFSVMGCLGVMLGAVDAAAAAPADWESAFRWDAPAECPRESDVVAKLSAVLSSDGFDEKTLDLGETKLRGAITRQGSSWVLDLDVMDDRGRRTRRLRADRCDDLAQAAALAIALLLEEKRAVAAAAEPPALEPPAVEPLRPRPVVLDAAAGAPAHPKDEAPATPAPPQHVALTLGADALVDSSTLAAVAFGASLRVQLRLGRYGFDAHAVLLPAQRQAVSADEDVEFAHFGAGLRACGMLADGTFGADVCAGGEAGWVSARGLGLIEAQQVDNFWLAPSLGLLGRWRWLAAGALISRLEVLLPLVRQPYVINRTTTVHETPSWTMRGSLGIELDVL